MTRRTALRQVLETTALVILMTAALIGAWQLIVWAAGLQSDVLPTPEEVWSAFLSNFSLIITSCETTFYEALVGFFIAIGVGVGAAVIVVYSRRIGQRVLMPYLVGFNAIPKVAIAPVIVIWLGLGIASKIGMSILLCFFPIVVNTASGLTRIDTELLDYFKLMQASKTTVFLRARLPNAMPAFFDGLKIALPIAIIGAIVGEFVAAQEGIGYEIIVAYSHFQVPLVFASVLVIAVASALLFQILVGVERLVIRWERSSER
jgi:NitT/TauT family transport system permease protein